MLTPPKDPWLLRGLENVGDGDRGKLADMGDTTKSPDPLFWVGVSGRVLVSVRLSTGGPSLLFDTGVAVGLGSVTGPGRVLP